MLSANFHHLNIFFYCQVSFTIRARKVCWFRIFDNKFNGSKTRGTAASWRQKSEENVYTTLFLLAMFYSYTIHIVKQIKHLVVKYLIIWARHAKWADLVLLFLVIPDKPITHSTTSPPTPLLVFLLLLVLLLCIFLTKIQSQKWWPFDDGLRVWVGESFHKLQWARSEEN